ASSYLSGAQSWRTKGSGMRKLHVLVFVLALVVAGLAAFTFAATAREDNNRNVSARLNGFNEVVGPGSISTSGSGVFTAKVDESGQMITYTLTYTLDAETFTPTGTTTPVLPTATA